MKSSIIPIAATIARSQRLYLQFESEKNMTKTLISALLALAFAPALLAQAPAAVNVRGEVRNVTDTGFTLALDSGQTTAVKEKPAFKVYERVPADLSRVQDSTFIGVTTVKQPDGKELATEIHIFPEEMRGAGEGSRMMNNAGTAAGSRMTNGAVAQTAMPESRMTNGAVAAKSSGGNMKVKYAGGEQDVVVPANVTVTEIRQASHKIANGDYVTVTGQRTGDGSLEADRATLAARP